jgi:HlyD family secretion protein
MLDISKPSLRACPTDIGNAEGQDRPLVRNGWYARNRRRLLFLAVLIVLVAAAGTGAWGLLFRPATAHTATLQRDVPVQVFGLGTVEARVTSQIGFKVAGVLADLRADVGDRVAKGAVLARLDNREQCADCSASTHSDSREQ